MKENKKRVALYIRVSSQEQKREGLSLDAQLRKLQQYCEFKGWEIFKIYKDEGLSAGTVDKRPNFKKMIEEAQSGKFSTILILKFDRAFRNVRDAINNFFDLMDIGIDFVSITEEIDTTTPTGRFFFVMISALAQLEKDMTADRNKFISRDKFERGIIPTRMPFGYKAIYKDKKKKKNVIGVRIDPKESKIVRECFNLTILGYSYKEICKRLKLKPQQYYNIIKNKSYCGYISFGGQEKKGIHEPIVSEEVFNEINSKK